MNDQASCYLPHNKEEIVHGHKKTNDNINELRPCPLCQKILHIIITRVDSTDSWFYQTSEATESDLANVPMCTD